MAEIFTKENEPNWPDVPTLGRRRKFAVNAGTAAQRVAAWANVMGPSGRIEIAKGGEDRFVGEVRSYALGEALALRVSSRDFRWIRDEAHVAGLARDQVFVNLVASGRIIGDVAGRKVAVPAGGVLVSRLCVTMDVRLENATWFGLIYPMSRMRLHLAWRAGLDAKIFPPGSASAVLLGHHLRSLMELPDDLSNALASRIGGQSLRFLLPHLGGNTGADEADAPSPDDFSFAIRRFISDHLRDPNLDAAMICREFALSRSRLYRLFEHGEGVSSVIRRLRLLCAHRDIASGLSRESPMAEIAHRWGFSDQRTFQRAFAAKFGVTPSVLQRRAAAGSDANPVHPGDAAAEVEQWFGS